MHSATSYPEWESQTGLNQALPNCSLKSIKMGTRFYIYQLGQLDLLTQPRNIYKALNKKDIHYLKDLFYYPKIDSGRVYIANV